MGEAGFPDGGICGRYAPRDAGTKTGSSKISNVSPPTDPTHTHEEVKALRENPLQHMLPSMVPTTAKLLAPLKMSILCPNDFIGFITSDAPCLWHDPVAYSNTPVGNVT